ncbi:hypothetical protein ATO13_06060 [Stappia sp. 22II-S9-Z10]|nr:hypothetical protein ATO13_06060 [Stappia sp. 22II-S9-Z10]
MLSSSETARDRVIDAAMGLLAAQPYETLTLSAIAEAAGVSLGELNAAFPSRIAIIEGFVRRVDAEVLSGTFDDMADEPPRERLFDVLMARLDALAHHRAALASLMRSARRDPALGLALNAFAVRSQVWMLAAAGVDATGLRGAVAAQALAAAYMQVLRVFVKEDDPGMPRTMAALDQALRRTEGRHSRLARFLGPAVRVRPAGARPEDAPDQPSASAGDPADEGDLAPSAMPFDDAAPVSMSTGDGSTASGDLPDDPLSHSAAPVEAGMPFDDAAPEMTPLDTEPERPAPAANETRPDEASADASSTDEDPAGART